ncbi:MULTISPECIES: helix-turn-helix domain-containing protein [Bacillus cereus group]|uniref:Transcriptional regulator n=1 Tax=Bacillus cereus TaxID=1396 RepID=A0A2B9DW91_BACCE|nr:MULTISPECIES: helix-turn-helix transcriptional regulator [Bacillus cereus group]PGM92272.1 transcriptional regulator [Bacillus cereus]QWG81936.1 XRE family transcriptional regulator [Bacillus mycoides]TXR76680.1 XRE family transcriptional regulator [Bacillus sp. AR13-1]
MRGERIKQLRKARGWTQDDLGEAVGFKKATISLIENNKRNREERSVTKFADVLDCTTDFLLGLSDDPKLSGEQNTRLKNDFDEIYNKLKELPEAEQEMYLRMINSFIDANKK